MEAAPTVSVADAPAGTEKLGAEWISVGVPDIGSLIAAVARPTGDGPFPTVLLLHGSHGFAQEYVRLAQDLARAGLLSVAACWFREGGGAGQRFITPIVWPKAPPVPDPLSDQSMQTVSALVRTVRNLPDALPNRIGLFGHSRGGGAALSYMLRAGDVQAGVLSSSRYPRQLADLASRMTAPVLMLHGTADGPGDGGTEFTNVEMARNFERALCAAGRPVEAVYYADGRHNDIFAHSTRYQDELKRMSAFYRQHLVGTT
ncbi:dienelactone hydrolase family protein [Bradyrhizobium sp. USDA 4502]